MIPSSITARYGVGSMAKVNSRNTPGTMLKKTLLAVLPAKIRHL